MGRNPTRAGADPLAVAASVLPARSDDGTLCVPMASDPVKRRLVTKKLLAAAVGIGAVSYVVACGETSPSGSSSADGGTAKDGALDVLVSSGNLMAIPPDAAPTDAGKDAEPDAGIITSGNLMPPPPSDASADAPTDGPDGGG